jgi:hypothetical protein
MLQFIKRTVPGTINGSLGLSGGGVMKSREQRHNGTSVKHCLSFEETLAGAREQGLSVGEYISLRHNLPGVSQATHDRLVSLEVFECREERAGEDAFPTPSPHPSPRN